MEICENSTTSRKRRRGEEKKILESHDSDQSLSLEDNLICSDTMVALRMMRTQFPHIDKVRSMFGLKGPSGFSRFSTAEEVTQGIDGSGLTAIVTGASSGLGTETARVLALRGVHVVMAVRNISSGKVAKEAVLKQNPAAKVDVMELDVSSIASVNNFASNFKSSGLPLNLLMTFSFDKPITGNHEKEFM